MYSEHVPLGAHYPRFNGIFDVPASGIRFRPHRAATFRVLEIRHDCLLFR